MPGIHHKGKMKKKFRVTSQYFETDMIPSHGPQGYPRELQWFKTLKEAKKFKKKVEAEGLTYIYRIEVID
jgi:hypothetical protein